LNRDIIAAQLYTVRDHLKTQDEVIAALKKLKKIGFGAIESGGISSIIAEKEMSRVLAGEGLVCCATHEDGKAIFDEPEKVAERLDLLGCSYVAYPWPHISPKSEADYQLLAKRLDHSGAVLAKAGKTLAYHNHSIEFERFGDRTGLEIVYGESKPENLKAELDTFWVQHGGANPVEWCEKLKGRLPLLHLKEFGIVDNQIKMLEIGNGNLDWKQIIRTAKESGCKWFVIEQDTCRIDPFDSLKISFEYLVDRV